MRALTGAAAGRGWRLAGMLLTVVALVAGVLEAGRLIADSGPLERDHQHQTYRQEIRRIEFDLDSGDIAIVAGANGEVRVDRWLRWHRHPPTLTEQWRGETLRISAECPPQRSCAVDYLVQVPAAVEVEAVSAAGDLSVRDLTGDLGLANEAGDITVTGVGGAIHVRGNAGDITGEGLRSTEVDVRTVAGEVALGFATAPTVASVTLEAGAIDISVPRTGGGADGYQVTATTTAGRRLVEVPEDSQGRHVIRAEIVDGDVIIRHP